MVRTLLLTFIPLFVAVDVVAVVLVSLGIGMPLDEAGRRRLVLEATMTAAAAGTGFLLVGDAVLHFLGVTVGDFQVAGGLLLLVACWETPAAGPSPRCSASSSRRSPSPSFAAG